MTITCRDYKEYNTDSTVRFVVTIPQDRLLKLEDEGLHKAFKLQSSLSISCMVRLTVSVFLKQLGL